MGNNFLDKYSLLHFASGVVAFHWSIDLPTWILFHVSFEVIENTQAGMKVINKYITRWPGGKKQPDSLTNILGDNFAAILGWWVSSKLDED